MFPMDVLSTNQKWTTDPPVRAYVVRSCITTPGSTGGNDIQFLDVFVIHAIITLIIIQHVMFRTAKNIVSVFPVLCLRDYGGGWGRGSIVLIVASLLSDIRGTREDVSYQCLTDEQC
jgi:hypothetical protein